MLVATLANLVEIPMIDLGCVTFLLEFAVVFKHGIYQGMFDIEKLPLPGVCYMASLFVLMVSANVLSQWAIGELNSAREFLTLEDRFRNIEAPSQRTTSSPSCGTATETHEPEMPAALCPAHCPAAHS